MTNATKTLALLFVGTLVLAFATSWSGSGSSSAAFQDQLLSVDSSAVEAIRIERPEASVRLEHSADGWTVRPGTQQSTAYAAQTRAVDRLLSTLPGLQVNAVATRQTAKHPRYGVDSTGTTVTLLGSNDETLGALIVGRTEYRQRDPSRQQQPGPMQQMQQNRGTPVTFVRSPDRNDVYSVQESLSSLVTPEVADWRDNQIWGVAQSNIQRVDLTLGGDTTSTDTSYTVQRTVPSDTASAAAETWRSDGDSLSTDAVSSMLRLVSSPRATSFANERSPDELESPRHTVRLHLKDGSRRILNLYSDPSGNTYLATANDYPYVARLSKDQWDRSVLQPRSHFLQSN